MLECFSSRLLLFGFSTHRQTKTLIYETLNVNCYQLARASDIFLGYFSDTWFTGERLVKNMAPLFQNIDIEPCLLHGDLWSGNISSDKNGEPVILDPACYCKLKIIWLLYHCVEAGLIFCENILHLYIWPNYVCCRMYVKKENTCLDD